MNLFSSVTMALVLSSGAAFAAEQTATLEVQNVVCSVCPPVVKSIISGVPGVVEVSISDTTPIATATVRFENTKTNAIALAQATTKAGFPTKVK